jgi:pimeloyl-ACP methyl ester carboxylesterase
VSKIHRDERRGGGPERGHPPLVLLHGSGGNRLHWPPEIRRMDGEDVYALDLPGHGKSDSPPEASIGGYAQRLIEWLSAFKLDRAVLVGHSMGGAIALHAALYKPKKIVGLVLVGSGARLRVHPSLLEVTSDPTRFNEAVAKITAWAFGAEAGASLVKLARKRFLETDSQTLHMDFLACDAFDLMGRLGEVEAPCLAICGSQDRLTPPKYSRYLADEMPNAEMRLIEGAGHMVMLERPQQVASAIKAFLEKRFSKRSKEKGGTPTP